MVSTKVTCSDTLEILSRGKIEPLGLVPWSSNYTFLTRVHLAGGELVAVYKPQEGERPLWDFDSGTLCQREVAAYLLSQQLGWPAIPPVVLRDDGPYGRGSLQLFIEHNLDDHYFALREDPSKIAQLKQIAVFDYLANNADRKGGHVFTSLDGQVWAIDHGLTFHEEYKLRTVIWDWAGEPIPSEWLADLVALRLALRKHDDPNNRALAGLITLQESQALLQRLGDILQHKRMPAPRRNQRNVPYPLI